MCFFVSYLQCAFTRIEILQNSKIMKLDLNNWFILSNTIILLISYAVLGYRIFLIKSILLHVPPLDIACPPVAPLFKSFVPLFEFLIWPPWWGVQI